MAPRLEPGSEGQLAEAIADAHADRRTLEVIGTGSLRQLGRGVASDAILSTAALDGIIDYQPAELMITLRPGTRMDQLRMALSERGQHLAFEPPTLSGLWGQTAPGTIGGVVGANLSGPRRFRAGAARDHVLAVRAVGGRGEVFKAGGKVVKNVTGYDLPKLLTGAFGTLAVISELTLKVLPRPRFEVTLLVRGQPVGAALSELRALAGDPREPTGLALVAETSGTCLAVRIEGSAASARDRAKTLASGFPDAATIEADESQFFWAGVRDVEWQAATPADAPLWRVSVPPSDAARVLDEARPAAFIADHAGGTLWLDRPMQGWEPDPAKMGALLVRGPEALRAARPTVASTGAVAALTERVRAQFDPARILNPGRLAAVAP